MNEDISSKPEILERNRRAPKAGELSDVGRFSDWLWAGACTALVTLFAAWLELGQEVAAPGPISFPHREAGLACASCHGQEPKHSALQACGGCHAVSSRRRPHAELVQNGQLSCTTCHPSHMPGAGIQVAPDGRVRRYGARLHAEIAGLSPARLRSTVRVALVPSARCAGCHDLEALADPIVSCLSKYGETLCFDEHRRAGSDEQPERDAAWQLARIAAVTAPLGYGPSPRPWWWLGFGLLAGLFFLIARRRTPLRLSRSGLARASGSATFTATTTGVKRLPIIDPTTCLGCYACVDACPYDVLAIRSYVAVVERPDECCGLVTCEQRCPNGSLLVKHLDQVEERLRTTSDLESCDRPGVYLCGDLIGMPLIRNAIEQGERATRAIAKDIGPDRKRDEQLDLAIVGAGPAGLSAALAAKQLGLRAAVLEQASLAFSIKSFPRNKLVLDPGDSQHGSALWLQECEKEVLLARWSRTIHTQNVDLREGIRVQSVGGSKESGFRIRAARTSGSSYDIFAKRVLLAVGRRGTVKKLPVPVPKAWESHVHYSLADARAFATKSVLIVGLGDVAMEAAIALSLQERTKVIISYRNTGFRRGKQRNIDAVERLLRTDRIRILWRTEVSQVNVGEVELRRQSGEISRHQVDALFVFIGSLPPWEFLGTCGIGPQANSPVDRSKRRLVR